MKMTRKEFLAARDAINRACMDTGMSYATRNELIEALETQWYSGFDVGDRGGVRYYTDIEPVTVVRKTACSVTVRFDSAKLDPSWHPEMIPGGFSAVCVNDDEQKWIIEENPDGPTETFRWSKKNSRYMNHGKVLIPGWTKYYDYNF